MRAEIDYLISKLDPDSDILLIHLLEQKLRVVEHYDVNITDKEIERTKVGINRTISSTLDSIHNDNPIVKKINKILDRGDNIWCNSCKHSITETTYYRDIPFTRNKQNTDNPVCVSCENRCDVLREYKEKLRDKLDFDSNQLGDDFIKSKALINKITNKLKQVKQ
jgi:hypothetical protein